MEPSGAQMICLHLTLIFLKAHFPVLLQMAVEKTIESLNEKSSDYFVVKAGP